MDPVSDATWHLYAFNGEPGNKNRLGPLKEVPSGVDDLTLNLFGAGNKFTQSVPMNDDNWHHLATTFGGTKKILVDGQENGIRQSVGIGDRFVFNTFFSVIRMPPDPTSQKLMMSDFTGGF